jgi:hypothetical protein
MARPECQFKLEGRRELNIFRRRICHFMELIRRFYEANEGEGIRSLPHALHQS